MFKYVDIKTNLVSTYLGAKIISNGVLDKAETLAETFESGTPH